MNVDFGKYQDSLVPAIVQDADSHAVLMLGYMNKEALDQTLATGRVTFFSRSRGRLWVKGETSGNFLLLVSATADCDNDALLVRARPAGPVCHTGTVTCFGDIDKDIITELQNVIRDRRVAPRGESYVSKLFAEGLNKIAQKVGEEAVETVIAAKDDDREAFKAEAADLLFHYLVLLEAKGISLADIGETLAERRRA